MGAKLVVLSGEQKGKEIFLSKGRKVSIGRGSDVDIRFTDRGVSRLHCYISFFDVITLEDVGSINGTFVNDCKINKIELAMGDIIMLGFAKLQLKEDNLRKKASDEETDRQSTVVIYRKEKEDPTFALKLKDVRAQWGLLLLHEVGKLVQKYTSTSELLKALLEQILEEFYAERGCAVLKPRSTQNNPLTVFCSRSDNRSAEYTNEAFSPSYAVLNAALSKGEGTVSADTSHDERFDEDSTAIRMNLHSIICVPIEGQKGTLGAIYMDSSSQNPAFEKQDLDLLTAISRQVGLALERLFLEEQLMASAQHYRLTCQSIIEHSLDVIYRRNPDQSFLLISPSVKKLLGYTPEEFLEKQDLWENCIHEEDKEYFLKQQEQVFSGKLSTTLSEFRMINKNGKMIWVGETSHAICDEGNQITCVQGLVKDITQNKESMEQIKENLEEKEVLLKEIHHRVKITCKSFPAS